MVGIEPESPRAFLFMSSEACVRQHFRSQEVLRSFASFPRRILDHEHGAYSRLAVVPCAPNVCSQPASMDRLLQMSRRALMGFFTERDREGKHAMTLAPGRDIYRLSIYASRELWMQMVSGWDALFDMQGKSSKSSPDLVPTRIHRA